MLIKTAKKEEDKGPSVHPAAKILGLPAAGVTLGTIASSRVAAKHPKLGAALPLLGSLGGLAGGIGWHVHDTNKRNEAYRKRKGINKKEGKEPTLKQRLTTPFRTLPEVFGGLAAGTAIGGTAALTLRKKAPVAAGLIGMGAPVAGAIAGGRLTKKKIEGWQEKAKRTRAANRLKKKMGLQTSK